MEKKLIIIGITGHPASGKDTVADYLVARGFSKVSGGDILREEMQKLEIPTDRSHLHEFVTEMRKRRGNGYLSEETIKRINGNTVISGIRNSEEVRVFREELGDNFKIIAVETPIEIRYQRAKERGRIGDNISFDQFSREEEREKAAESGSHEVNLVIATADTIIENNGTPEDLFQKVDKFLESIGYSPMIKEDRP